MSSFLINPASVRVACPDGSVLEFESRDFRIDHRAEPLDVTSFEMGRFVPYHVRTPTAVFCTIEPSGFRVGEQSDEERLARAVLAGDLQAALLLADLVQERHLRKCS